MQPVPPVDLSSLLCFLVFFLVRLSQLVTQSWLVVLMLMFTLSAALAGGGPSLDQRLNRARTQTYQVRTAAMLDVLKERGLLRSTSDQAVSQGLV